jgi:DNA replication initiation complex subunit (GINS family)
VGPLIAGQEAEFEPWEVRVLERHGLVEPIQRLTTAELRKFMLAEERASGLGPLPPSFYAAVAQRAASMRASSQPDEIEEFRAAFEALTEIRTHKLLRAALSPANAENMLPEERFIVNRLAMVLEDWWRWLTELLEKEVEIGETA